MSKNDLHLDELKVLKMLAVHEICEIDVKDFTPFDHILRAKKHEREAECVYKIATEYKLHEFEVLWQGFKEKRTSESVFAKAIDHFDTYMQSKIYAKEANLDVGERFSYYKDDIEYIKSLKM